MGRIRRGQGTRGGAPRFVCMNDAPKVSPTDLAEDRTILASERTFAGWTRTSLGCIALGLGFHALFSTMEAEWAPRVIATGFLLLELLLGLIKLR